LNHFGEILMMVENIFKNIYVILCESFIQG